MTGYAVALPDDLSSTGELIWYGGGKLAADLTLPKLRHRWRPEGHPPSDPRSTDYHPVTGRLLSARSARAVLRNAARHAAGRSGSSQEFFTDLEGSGFLVRLRFSRQNPDQITGYALTIPGHNDRQGQPRWYSGASLADDLSLTHLQRRWRSEGATGHDAPPVSSTDLTAQERQALYEDAIRAADYATGNRHLHHAANAYDRAARQPYGRIPRPSTAGHALRTAARLLAITGALDPQTIAIATLATSLIALLDTIEQLHRAQRRNTQANATRSAHHHVHRLTSRHAAGASSTDTPTSQIGRVPPEIAAVPPLTMSDAVSRIQNSRPTEASGTGPTGPILR